MHFFLWTKVTGLKTTSLHDLLCETTATFKNTTIFQACWIAMVAILWKCTFSFSFIVYFIYLLVVGLGLCCCAWAFSSCGPQGLLLWLWCMGFVVAASLVFGAQAPGSRSFSSCGFLPWHPPSQTKLDACPLHWQVDFYPCFTGSPTIFF